MLEEGNERRGDGDELLWRDVHVIDVARPRQRHVALCAREHQLLDEAAVGVQRRVRLRDDRILFLVCVQPRQLVRHLAVPDDTIWRLDESEVVHARVACQRRDESDVRAFRRLDRAHAAVLRIVHISHFEAGALARQTTWSERRKPALVRQLGERIRLIHELREL